MQQIGSFRQILDLMTSVPEETRQKLEPKLKKLDVAWITVNQMSFGQAMAVYALARNKEKIQPALKDFMAVMLAMCDNVTNLIDGKEPLDPVESATLSKQCVDALHSITDLPDLGVTISGNFMASLPGLWISYAQKFMFTWGAVQQALDGDDAAYFCDLIKQLHSAKLKMLVRKIERGVFHENSTTFRLGEKWAKEATAVFETHRKKKLSVDECFMAVVEKAPPPWMS